MEIYQGRPETNEGRVQKEIAVYDLLDELQISYDLVTDRFQSAITLLRRMIVVFTRLQQEHNMCVPVALC